MINLLFFSRLELTNYYGRLDKYLLDSCKIYHMAYSDIEEKCCVMTMVFQKFIILSIASELLPKCKLDLSIKKMMTLYGCQRRFFQTLRLVRSFF